MIDSVSMSLQIHIPSSELTKPKWKKLPAKGDYQPAYLHRENDVTIKYFPHTHTLRIRGKIIRLVSDSSIKNFDDIYGTDRDAFINDINESINRLFKTISVDIREFTVSRIDYCFNVRTPFVKEYLDFLTGAFNAVNTGVRKNFAYERDKSGSVYVKTRSDYENNRNTNYVLNFYDKEDWLNNKKKERVNFSQEDVDYAQGIFRLEIQAYSKCIKSIEKKHRVSRTFEDLFSFEIAQATLEDVYRKVFKAGIEHEFYKYASAKQIAESPRAKEVLQRSAEHHQVTSQEYSYIVKQIKNSGIYPYYFLPKSFELDVLPSPLWLIKDKIQQLHNQS